LNHTRERRQTIGVLPERANWKNNTHSFELETPTETGKRMQRCCSKDL